MTSAIAPFAEPSLPEGAEERAPARSGAKGKAKSSPKAESSEHASASYPSAWFGTYGTAVSRAIVSGKEAARWVPETIIDTDDRVLVRETNSNPFRWLCRLVILASNGTRWSGTGWLIGPNVVMTAGHCVYMQNQGGWAQRIQVFCYNDAGELSNATEAEEAATVDGWMANANPEDDYAVISLPKGGEPRGWFGFANLDDGALMRAVGNIAGFPVDKPVGTLWGHARRLSQVRPNALFYDIDTYGGMSGAPVICWNGQDYIVVGIHNYGDLSGNRATRINSVVCQNMEAWLTDYA